MQTTQYARAIYGLGVLLGLTPALGLAPAVAQEKGHPIEAAGPAVKSAMRYEILSLKRRDGGTQTLQVIYGDDSDGALQAGRLATKD